MQGRGRSRGRRPDEAGRPAPSSSSRADESAGMVSNIYFPVTICKF